MAKNERTIILKLVKDGAGEITVDIPIAKCASIKAREGMDFFYLERKPGKEGYTFNYTESLIPEGYRLGSMTMVRGDIEESDRDRREKILT